jgi:hypothetical protein
LLTVGLILIVGNIVVRLAAMPRLYAWARRRTPLPFYCAFLTLALTQAIVIQPGWWIFHRMDVYKAVQQQMFSIMTGMQIAVILEAFWWLVTCLPRFRKIGGVLMVACAFLSYVVARPTGHSYSDLERGFGFGLATFVCLTLGVHRVIGTECKPALWHAGCLGGLSLFNGMIWSLQPDRALMTLSYVLQVGASAMWLLKVKAPPTWKEPVPVGTEKDVTDAIRRMEQAGQRKPGSILQRAGQH